MQMSLGQLIGYLAGIIVVLSTFIEITPVKINPVSAALNWLGKKINREMIARVDELEKKMDAMAKVQNEMEERFAEKDAINSRVRILRFSDELRRDVRHSKESFEQTLADIDEYEHYCDKHPDFKNNKTMTAKERIKSAYDSCMSKDNFL